MKQLRYVFAALLLASVGCSSDNPPAGSISLPKGANSPEASAAPAAPGAPTPSPGGEAVQRTGRGID